LPLCAGMPLDSCSVMAASLAALFDRRRTVVPFPFLTVAIASKNLLEKNRRATFLLTDTVCSAPGQESDQPFHNTPAVRSCVEIGRPFEIQRHLIS
jgi:hypothetical protein